MNCDTKGLNSIFDTDGPEFIELTEEEMMPVAWQHIEPFWTGKKHSEETKALISEKMSGIKRTPEQNQNNSRAQKGKVYSEEYKRNMEVACSKNSYELTFADGSVKVVKGLNRWCKDNGYTYVNVQFVKSGRQKFHKDIVKVEKLCYNVSNHQSSPLV